MQADRRRFLRLTAAASALPLLAGCGVHEKTTVAGVPASPFDEDATAEQVTDGIDLDGKVAVVTGCTSGIGLETMRVLALRGAWVLDTSRSLDRAEVACRGILIIRAEQRDYIGRIEKMSFDSRQSVDLDNDVRINKDQHIRCRRVRRATVARMRGSSRTAG